MKEVGQFYASGIPNVMEKDLKKSVGYFEQAAARNFLPAKYLLAECLVDGKGVSRDEERGRRLMREAADAKEIHAMANMGAYLARYDASRPDSARKEEYEQAFKFLSEAKDEGILEAQESLGAMYMNGTVPGLKGPDFKKGVELFKDGAKKENAACMFQYARCLQNGIGTKANQLEAVNWYVKAAKEGSKGAIDWCRANPKLTPGYTPPPLTGPPATLTGPPQSLTQ